MVLRSLHNLTLDGHYENIFIFINQLITSCAVLGIIVLGCIWFVYFLRRARVLSRKIHYLKKQTDERCHEELTNARVDYIRSIFIAAISAFEIVPHVILPGFFAFQNILDENLVNNCSTQKFFYYSYNVPVYRVFSVIALSSLIIALSLIHILTCYLNNAYGQKRIVTLTNRERLLFVWMLIQLIVVWASIANWRAFLFTLPMVSALLFSSHLYLYCKYSHRLYLLLKRRKLDAWFEDQDNFRKLDRMCKDYRRGSILYVICISLLLTFLAYLFIEILLKTLLRGSCILAIIFDRDFNFIHRFYSQHPQALSIVFRIIGDPVISFLAIIVLLIQFSIHFWIFFQAVWRIRQRNKAIKNFKFNTNNRSAIFQPLIGNR